LITKTSLFVVIISIEALLYHYKKTKTVHRILTTKLTTKGIKACNYRYFHFIFAGIFKKIIAIYVKA